MQKYLYESDVIHAIGNADNANGMSELESRVFGNICKAVSALTGFTCIYAVTVQSEYSLPKLSEECYTTLKEAQDFIETRSDKPEKITEYKYQSARTEYKIHTLQIR